VAFADRWHGKADGRITTSIAPHAPYTVTTTNCAPPPTRHRELGVKVHIHASEDTAQTNASLNARGITPIQVLEDTGVLDAGVDHRPRQRHPRPTTSRCWVQHRDRVGVTHGPKGYLKFALGPLTPIAGLRAAGVPVGYCTDGAASNNTLDIFEDMRITAILQKQLRDDATWFKSAMALEMAGPSRRRCWACAARSASCGRRSAPM
jgi:cytosine/adenosine deaminase-related metal-dependent hydrolase